MMPTPNEDSAPTLPLQSAIDVVCADFQVKWREGFRPNIVDFAYAAEEPLSERLLYELIRIDVVQRRIIGDAPTEGDYLSKFPNLAETIRRALATAENSNLQLTQIDTALRANNVAHVVNASIDKSFSTIPTSPESGQSSWIGNYKLLQKLGEGGMGEVWMAEQTKPVRRMVALKLIKPGLDNKQVIARFEAERQALAMMDHPNIARVLDAGTTPTGAPYFVMELVRGIPFTKYCDQHKLSIDDRLWLFIPVCQAIQHAHQKGIIHRDLKPSNVLVSLYDGKAVPKVIDFGLAKALQQQTKLTDKTMFTEFGQVVGTIQYMSPEQAELNQLDVDTRTDIYSLGVMLYELLTGSTPIEADTLRKQALLQVLATIRDQEPPRPSDRLSSASNEAASGISSQRQIDPSRLKQILKGELDWIVMKSIEKDRTRRYDTAIGLADDLRNYLHGEVVTARPPSSMYQLRKYVVRHRGLVSALTAIVMLMFAGTAGVAWFAYSAYSAKLLADSRASEVLAEKSRVEAESKRATAEAIRASSEAEKARQAEHQAAVALESTEAALARSNFMLADSVRQSYRSSLAKKMLFEIPKRYRGIEWNLSLRRADGADITCYGHTGRVYGVRYAPSGNNIASCGQAGEVMVWDAITGKLLRSISTPEDITSLCYHPQGNILLANSHQQLSIIEVENGQVQNSVACPGIRCSQFINEGRHVIAGQKDGTVKFFESTNLKQLREITAHQGSVEAVCSSATAKMFATAAADGSIKLWSLKSGLLIRTLKGHESIASCIDFHPTGKTLVSGGWDGFVRVWDTESGQLLQSSKAHDDKVFSVAFSPAGTEYASSGYDGLVRTWSSSGGGLLDTFSGHDTAGHGNGAVYSVCYHPDAHRIASGGLDSTVRIWDAAIGTNDCELRGHNSYVEDAQWSPDGKFLASAGSDGLLFLWDSVTGVALAKYSENSPLSSLTFNPVEQQIAFGAGKQVKVYDVKSKSITAVLSCVDTVTGVVYSYDGKWIATACGNGKLLIWDGINSKPQQQIQGHDGPIFSLAVSTDGHQIATGGQDGDIRLWNALDGSLIWKVAGGRGWTQCLAFSPDGTNIASGHERNLIQIWRTSDSERLTALDGHTSRVHSLCYTPDGTRIISGGYEGTLKIWESGSGVELMSLNLHNNWLTSVNFDPLRQRIASTGRDGVIRILDASDNFEAMFLNDAKIARKLTFDVSEQFLRLDASFDANVSSEHLSATTGIAMTDVASADFGEQAVVIGFSPKGNYFVYPRRSGIFLVDNHFKERQEIQGYRTLKAHAGSRWHAQKATEAEASQDEFAAKFHRRRAGPPDSPPEPQLD